MSAHGMADIAVSILRWVADDQPGIVEFSLVDCYGKDWRFVDKLPMVTTQALDETSTYPQPGSIRCEIVSFETDETGRVLVQIDTERPWYIEAVDETHVFKVESERLDQNVPDETEASKPVVTVVVTGIRKR